MSANDAKLTPMTPQADDWDQHWSDFSPSSDIAPSTAYRRRVILHHLLGLKRPGAGARVLEIGSGTGSFAERFAAVFPQAEFLGLDLSATGIEMSRSKVPGAQFRQRNLLLPPAAEDDLDFGATHAIASEVLEHIDDPETLLRNAKPYMAPGCRLIITVPGGPISAFHRHIGHRRHYTADLLRDLLVRAGFEVEHSKGIGFPFFNLYMSLLVWRGEKAIQLVSGEPSLAIRLASRVFNGLFHLNSLNAGWQIVAIARYRA